MSFKNCATCGKPFIRGIDTIYSDGGVLEVNHGGGQCRECYSLNHPECPNCKKLNEAI